MTASKTYFFDNYDVCLFGKWLYGMPHIYIFKMCDWMYAVILLLFAEYLGTRCNIENLKRRPLVEF